MTEIYATAQLGGGDTRNVEYLGALVAWLVINDMLAPDIERAVGAKVSRIRMQDLTGPEFLTTVLHGQLTAAQLNETGRRFVEHYFMSGQYQRDYEACEYRGNDEWARYDEIAPKITAAHRHFTRPVSKLRQRTAKILKFPGT